MWTEIKIKTYFYRLFFKICTYITYMREVKIQQNKKQDKIKTYLRFTNNVKHAFFEELLKFSKGVGAGMGLCFTTKVIISNIIFTLIN